MSARHALLQVNNNGACPQYAMVTLICCYMAWFPLASYYSLQSLSQVHMNGLGLRIRREARLT
jgi:hypothetical protein